MIHSARKILSELPEGHAPAREFRTVVRKSGQSHILYMMLSDDDIWILLAKILHDNKVASYREAFAECVEYLTGEFSAGISIAGARSAVCEEGAFPGVEILADGGIPPRVLEPVVSLPEIPQTERGTFLLEGLETIFLRSSSDPNVFAPSIDDETPTVHDLTRSKKAGKFPDMSTIPSALMLGGAGAGKSTLTGELFGLRANDIPSSGVSRTTLSPILFTNTSDDYSFGMVVCLHEKEDARNIVRERISAAIFAASNDVESELMTAPDQTTDLRCVLGTIRKNPGRWEEALRHVRQIRTLSGVEHFEEFVHESPIIDHIAQTVVDEVYEAIYALPFGSMTRSENELTFQYRSASKNAMAEASRRFISTKRKHWGQSFAPFVMWTWLSGPLVRGPEFTLIDHRGIDHENGSMPVPEDVIGVAEQVDRIIVVETCEKPGSRETVRALADIFSRGISKPLIFVGTKSDIVTDAGEDPAEKMSKGIRNALTALGKSVGENAAAAVSRDLDHMPPIIFSGLDKASTTPLGERDDDNAEQALILLAAVSSPQSLSEKFSAREVGLTYDEETMRDAVISALALVPGIVRDHYGDDDKNSVAGHHWGTIKAESARLNRAMSEGSKVTCQSSRLTAHVARDVIDSLSRFLDAPVSAGRGGRAFSKESVDQAVHDLRRSVSGRVESFIVRKLVFDNRKLWQKAMKLSFKTFGKGSTTARGNLIRKMADTFSAGPDEMMKEIKIILDENMVRLESER